MVVKNEIIGPTKRWTPLIPHAGQHRYWRSTSRFNICHSGRRSGKTEIAKRRVVKKGLQFTGHPDGLFIFGAPTHRQARAIFWGDVQRLIPPWMIRKKREVTTEIELITGTTFLVFGFDAPDRAEGRPIDGGVLDEYGNMKPTVWSENLRPALDTINRPGWMDFIGVPEGRNHYYDLVKAAESDETNNWTTHHWKSSDLLSPEAIAAAMADLDELTYKQEYEGDFVTFQGRAYYSFNATWHCLRGIPYDPNADLVINFDFNRAPGVAVISQEKSVYEHGMPALNQYVEEQFTGVIGEVYIPQNSNTPLVCNRLINDWGQHVGRVICYGDSTGGNKTAAAVSGSDWDIIEQYLRPVFGQRLFFKVPRNGPERNRVNAVNSRLWTMAETIRMLVDPIKAPNVVKDFEGVRLVDGGSGEIDKNADKRLTHPTDALGYYVVTEYPVHTGTSGRTHALV